MDSLGLRFPLALFSNPVQREAAGETANLLSDSNPQAFTDKIYRFFLQVGVERECQGTLSDSLCHRKITGPVAESVNIEGLQVDRGEIWPASNPSLPQSPHHEVSIDTGVQANDVDEPAHPGGRGSNIGNSQPGKATQSLIVHLGYTVSLFQDLIEARHLSQT